MKEAEKLFKSYQCSYYFMSLDGTIDEYKSYNIDEETEEKWTQEFIENCIDNITAENAHHNVMGIYHLGMGVANKKQLDRLFDKILEINDINDQDIIMISEDIQQMSRKGYNVSKEKGRDIIKKLLNKVQDVNVLNERFSRSYNLLKEYCNEENQVDEIALEHLTLQLSIIIGEATRNCDNKNIVVKKMKDAKLILNRLKEELNIE